MIRIIYNKCEMFSILYLPIYLNKDRRFPHEITYFYFKNIKSFSMSTIRKVIEFSRPRLFIFNEFYEFFTIIYLF